MIEFDKPCLGYKIGIKREYFISLAHITYTIHYTLKNLPDADIIVHSGNFTVTGSENEAIDFINWFCDLPYRHKISLAGSHDVYMFNAKFNGLPENVHILNNPGVRIKKLKVYGMPFFIEHDIISEEIKHIEAIPADSDIIVTHQSPLNILDFSDNIHYGSQLLREQIIKNQTVLPSFWIYPQQLWYNLSKWYYFFKYGIPW